MTDTGNVDEFLSIGTLERSVIGETLDRALNSSKTKFNLDDLVEAYGKKGDPKKLEFVIFEDSVSGTEFVYSRGGSQYIKGQTVPSSGGKLDTSRIVEMDVREAEKYLLQQQYDNVGAERLKVSGATKFNDPKYKEAGGEDYTELVLNLKVIKQLILLKNKYQILQAF